MTIRDFLTNMPIPDGWWTVVYVRAQFGDDIIYKSNEEDLGKLQDILDDMWCADMEISEVETADFQYKIKTSTLRIDVWTKSQTACLYRYVLAKRLSQETLDAFYMGHGSDQEAIDIIPAIERKFKDSIVCSVVRAEVDYYDLDEPTDSLEVLVWPKDKALIPTHRIKTNTFMRKEDLK